MIEFKKHVEGILCAEIAIMIEQQGYFLETEFCNIVCEKFNFRISTVRPVLRRIYPELQLIKRRLSNELKDFYGLDVKGCPIIYLKNC